MKRRPVAGLAAGLILFGSSNWALGQTKWDMPTGYPPNNFHTENIQQFAADVDKATGGKLKITVHSGGSLFKAHEIKRSVQGGQAQIGEILMSGLANEDPLFGLDSIPFLATSYPQAMKLWQASKPATEAKLGKAGLRVLYSVPWPPQDIFSAKPIKSAADLKGAKWRAYNPGTSRIAQLVGAQPVTIQAAELTQALATGAVNAFMTSPATAYDSKIWEQLKHGYNVRGWLPKNLVIVNKKAFDALDKPAQDALLKAASAAQERGWQVSEEKTKFYLEQLAKNGLKVEQPSPALAADMKKIGERMVAEWAKQSGPDGQAVLDAYRK